VETIIDEEEAFLTATAALVNTELKYFVRFTYFPQEVDPQT